MPKTVHAEGDARSIVAACEAHVEKALGIGAHAAAQQRIVELEKALKLTLGLMAEIGASSLFDENNQRVTFAELNTILKNSKPASPSATLSASET